MFGVGGDDYMWFATVLMYMWFATHDSDTLRIFRDDMSCLYGRCEVSCMIAFWPLSQIRLRVQLVGVLRLRCPHGICMFFGGPC